MAFTNETTTSISDLITKLDGWMSSSGGWTAEHLDTSTAAVTGGEWAMRRIGAANTAVTSIDGTTDVDDINEEFDLTGHGFDDGEYVFYEKGSGTVITGLVTGKAYFAHVIDSNTISLHTSRVDALADTARVGLTDTASSTTNSLTPQGTQIRFAASWDSENSGLLLSIYQYFHQDYVIGDRPWGQDHDSGNGFAGTTPDSSIDGARYVTLGATPIQYWAYEDDDYTHIVVETSIGVYQHFGFGVLDKLGGGWIGGEYAYGQRDNKTVFSSAAAVWDGMSWLLDGHTNDTSQGGGQSDDMEDFAATIHMVDMPNQTTDGMWSVCMGGGTSSPQTDFGFDRQSNDGSSSDIARENVTWGLRDGPFAQQFQRFDGTDISGHIAMWPICITYVDSSGDIHGMPLATMKDVVGMNIKNYAGAQEIVIAGDIWTVFPANRKWPGSGTGSSGYLGVAYKQVT